MNIFVNHILLKCMQIHKIWGKSEYNTSSFILDFPGGQCKESFCHCRRGMTCRFNPWVEKTPSSRKWQPTTVFLPGKFHGQSSLVGCSPWGCKESDMTEPARVSCQPLLWNSCMSGTMLSIDSACRFYNSCFRNKIETQKVQEMCPRWHI